MVGDVPGWKCSYPNCIQLNPPGEKKCLVEKCYGFRPGDDIKADSYVLTELIGVKGQIQFVIVLTREDLKNNEANIMRSTDVLHLRKSGPKDEWEILDLGEKTDVSFHNLVGILPEPTSKTATTYSFPRGTMPKDVIRLSCILPVSSSTTARRSSN